jgi:uncharacterized protein YbaP (TraB family)
MISTMRKRRMRGIWGGLILFVFTALPAAQFSADAGSNSFLWEVRNGGQKIHLLGSIHFLRQEDYPLKGAVNTVFRDATAVAFEVNLDRAETPNTQQMILSKASYNDGTTLKQHLSQSTYALAEAQCRALGLPMDQLNRFKPWFFSISLIAFKLQNLGFDPNHGIDKHFFRKAKQAQKRILALETIEDQINLLAELPEPDQERLVLQTLKELDIMEKEMATVIRAWKSGDTNVLDRTLLKHFKEYPELYRQFIVMRNKKWLPQIEGFLRGGETVLVIVGSGHLIGTHGLIHLLKAKGYTVEQR